MKTLVYTVKLTTDQENQVGEWLQTLRHVWNKGLDLLLELERFSTWDKHTKSRHASVPISVLGGLVDGNVIAPWQYRWMADPNTESEKKKWIAVPYTPLTSFSHYRKPYRMCCPIPMDWQEPRLDSPTAFSLAKMFAHKRHPDWPELQVVPANFIRGVTASLATAWTEYKKGRMGEPRFKGVRHGVNSLVNADAKSIKIVHNKIKIPLLGEIEVNAGDIWDNVPICVLKLCRMPWGWQLQLTGELPEKICKPSKRSTVLEFPRVEGLLCRDEKGKEVKPYSNPYLEKRLSKLQNQLAQKQMVRQNRINKLGVHIPQSKAELDIRRKIKALEWKLAKGADQHSQKLSTYMIRTYGDLTLLPAIASPIPHPEPIVGSDGNYKPNGADRVARFNNKVMRLRTGKLRELLKAKAAKHNRVLVEQKSEKAKKRKSLPKNEKGDTIQASPFVSRGV